MSLDILVVDDEQDIRDLISDILEDEGYHPRVAGNSVEAFEAIERRVPAAVILDIWLQGSDLDGLGILESIQVHHPNLPIIIISGHGNIETAINSIKMGAYDYLEKPFKEDKLLLLIERAIENAKLKQENAELKQRGAYESQLIGSSAPIAQLRQTIHKVAPTESRVLIHGPAGSGKEVIARAIHENSLRRSRPFVLFNASTIDENDVEAELFGVEENFVTEGRKRKLGVFEKAHGGTLFLDEVADMPLSVQAKIVKTLQEKSFRRVGGQRVVEVDVRVIASSNKDLKIAMEEGEFREDLYYRLNVVNINVPALKERREDLRHLVSYFVTRSSELIGLSPKALSDSALAAMEVYDWPGNIRQLRNVIEYLLITAKDNESNSIEVSMLPSEIISPSSESSSSMQFSADMMGMNLRDAREIFEREYLKAQLERFAYNVSKTSEFVCMERSALHRKMKSLNIHSSEMKQGE